MADSTTGAAAAMPRGRAHLCVALLTLLGFALGCSEFIVIGIETEIAETFGVSLARVGELISFFAVTYAAGTPVLALTTGRFRRYTLLVAYCAVFCAANFVAMVAPTFEVLLVSRVLIGAVSGALLAVGVTYLPELISGNRVSMAISVVYGAFSVAMVIATSAGKMIAHALDWHLAMVAVFVLCVATCVALVAVLPRSGATDEPATAREQIVLLRQPNVLTGILIFVFGVGSVYVFYGYITPYLEEVLGMSALGASAVLMCYGGVCIVSNLLSGWVDTRFGMPALLVTFPVQALFLLALYLVSPAMPASLICVFGVALIMYIASLSCISTFMRTARLECPKALTLAASLEPMAFNIGIAFGTAVGGAVVSGPGLAFTGLVGSGFSLVACALTGVTIALTKRADARHAAAE